VKRNGILEHIQISDTILPKNFPKKNAKSKLSSKKNSKGLRKDRL